MESEVSPGTCSAALRVTSVLSNSELSVARRRSCASPSSVPNAPGIVFSTIVEVASYVFGSSSDSISAAPVITMTIPAISQRLRRNATT
jgi:hypothetical protein